MIYKKIALPICMASAALMLSACGGGSSGTSDGVTGVFKDSVVQNLPYTCSPSGKSGTTDSNGEFSCNEADEVSFQLGATTLGPVEMQGVVTPYKIFPNDEEAAINLAQLIQSLDDDGVYESAITLTPEMLEDILIEEIDFGSNSFDDDVQAMLDDANLTLVDAQTAEDHLHASDTDIPVVTLLGDKTVEIAVGTEYMDPGATAYDEFEGTLDPTRSGEVDTSTVGIYSLTYSATDSAGNTGVSETRTVIVLDGTAPTVTLNGDATVTINVGDTYVDAGATATDAYDGEIIPEMSGSVNTAVPGTYTITWIATDDAGNAGTASRTVIVVDNVAPVITLIGDPVVAIMVGDSYTDAGATATDNVDGTLTPVMSGSVNTGAAGTYTITWTATDAAGNASSVSRTVIVQAAPEDVIPPIVTLNGDATVTISVGDSYTDAGATAMDNVDGTLTPVMSGSVNTAAAGTYTITWTATDAVGNVGTAVRTVIVEADTTPPVVTLNGDATVTITLGDSYTDAGATATDNVDGTLTPVMSGSVNTAMAGTYTITWTATDTAGNVGTADRTVIVAEEGNTPTTPEELEASAIGDACIDLNGDAGVVYKDTDPFGNPIPGTATCVAEEAPTPTSQEELEASAIGDACIDTNGDAGVVYKDTDPFGNPIDTSATCVAEEAPTPTSQEELEASAIGDVCIDTNGVEGVVAKDTDPFGNPIDTSATCSVA